MAPYQELLKRHHDEGTMSDAVYRVLRHCIIDGSLASGSRLQEEKLAKEMGVSRTPVREALRKLEAEEFVVARPRKGLVVCALSEEDLVEIFQVREALEGMAARLAATNAAPPAVAGLDRLVAEMETAASGDANHLRDLTGEFHLAVARASGNSRLVRMIGKLQDRVRQFGNSTLFLPDQPGAAIEEHRALLEMIKAKDADGAEEIVRRHRRRTLEVRLQMRRPRPA